MRRFVEGIDQGRRRCFRSVLKTNRKQGRNPIRVVDAALLTSSTYRGWVRWSGRRGDGPGWYHPAVLLKLYIYGYLNQVESEPAA